MNTQAPHHDYKAGTIVSAYVPTRGRRHIVVRADFGTPGDYPWQIIDGTAVDGGGLGPIGPNNVRDIRPVQIIDPEDSTKVVIDYEDREQVERLEASMAKRLGWTKDVGDLLDRVGAMQAALREFANPKPSEPSDPRTRVTDRRDNIWRLLADGDWVCTSGPDIGEYLNWDQLAGDRGPVTVEVQS